MNRVVESCKNLVAEAQESVSQLAKKDLAAGTAGVIILMGALTGCSADDKGTCVPGSEYCTDQDLNADEAASSTTPRTTTPRTTTSTTTEAAPTSSSVPTTTTSEASTTAATTASVPAQPSAAPATSTAPSSTRPPETYTATIDYSQATMDACIAEGDPPKVPVRNNLDCAGYVIGLAHGEVAVDCFVHIPGNPDEVWASLNFGSQHGYIPQIVLPETWGMDLGPCNTAIGEDPAGYSYYN